jgi:hypothetical protein
MSEGGSLDNSKRKNMLRAGLVAGALGAAVPAHGQSVEQQADFIPQQTYEQPYDSDYGGKDHVAGGYDYGSADYVSEEVVNLFKELDEEVGDSNSITPEQIAKIHTKIDDFISKHPAYEGKKIEGTEGADNTYEPSYSPYLELQNGLWLGPEKNPLVIGFAVAYIKQKALESVPRQQ